MDRLGSILVTGRRHQAAGTWSAAEECYGQPVQAYPDDAEAWRALADVCLAQRRLAEAVPCLQQVGRAQGQFPQGVIPL